jgi:hypothetical protein
MKLKYYFIIFFLLAGVSGLQGQVTDAMFGDIEGRQIGPARMSGRISCLDAQNSDPNILWV